MPRRHRSQRPTRRPHRSRGPEVLPRPDGTADRTAPWVARSEADLVAVVPQVLGFHPEDSVVVLSFGGPQSFHARADLPLRADHRGELADLLAGACRDNAARTAAVLLYTSHHGRARDQGEALVRALHAAGLDVVDVLRVHDGRWFEPLRDDRTGTAFDLGSHPMTARGVFEGRRVHPDREAVQATLHGGDDAERERLARAAAVRRALVWSDARDDALPLEARWVRERVRRATTSGERLDVADAARLLDAVDHGLLREAAWVDVRRDVAAAHVDLWLDLVRRAPRPLLPGACGLLALAAYLAGDGALAWCAVDRCREVVDEHTLVDLVDTMLASARPPSAWPGARAEDVLLLAAPVDLPPT